MLDEFRRHQEEAGNLSFACFKDEDEGLECRLQPHFRAARGRSITAELGAWVSGHGYRDAQALSDYRKSEPLRNLLWFPETYRRPGENRQAENLVKELALDFRFFQKSARKRETWLGALDYILFREIQTDWYNSEFFSFLPKP